MIACDVNVLLAALRADHDDHRIAVEEVAGRLHGVEPYGVSELVLSAVVRIATHPTASSSPVPLDLALAFAAQQRTAPSARVLRPGPRHWDIFAGLCRDGRARGNLVADAYHAALAIEHGCEWVTFDRDYARFPGLRWRDPRD